MDCGDQGQPKVDAMNSDASDPRFYRLLYVAWSNLELAATLVKAEPSIVEARNSIGETAFHFLVVENAQEAVEWLLKHGSNINAKNAFGETPLMNAAQLGYLGMCRFLLARGADVRLRDDSEETALAHAAEATEVTEDRIELLKLLLDQLDASEDINHFFADLTAHLVLKAPGPITELLEARGLVDTWR